MHFTDILKLIIKNLFAMVIGSISCFLVLWLFLMKPLLDLTIPRDNLGSVIGGAIVFPVIFSIFSIIIGAVLGLIAYNLFKFMKKGH